MPTTPRAGSLASETLPGGKTTTYAYDPADNLTSLTDSGGQVSYAYDNLNRLSSVTEPGAKGPITFSYDQDDHRTGTSYPNGVNVTNAYDHAGHLTSTSAAGPGGTLFSDAFNYTQGTADRDVIQSATDKSGNQTSYTYDALGRLTEAKSPSDDRAYAYDGAGNLTSATINGKATSYSYNAANQLSGDGTSSYSYDANGNQTGSSAGLALAYNAKNQTASVTAPGQQAASLSYLGAGQDELTQDAGASLTNDLLGVGSRTDQSGSTYYTRDSDGTLLAERTSGGEYYPVEDNLGSLVALTDSGGNAADTASYDPYGNTTSTTGTVPNAFGYAQGLQAPAGLYHYGARYDAPATGRWTQQDPLGQPGDPVQANLYASAGDDPINIFDSSGLYDIGSTAKACAKSGLQSGAVSGGDLEAAGVGCATGALSDFAKQEGCDTCSKVIDTVGNAADLKTAVKTGEKALSGLASDVGIG